MTPEQQRIAIARAVGLKLVSDSGLSFAELYHMDGYSHNSGKLQHIVDAWVCTDESNPEGVWLRGGCSQAVEDKAVAEKWAAEYPGERTVVAVKKCLGVPDYLNNLDAMHEAESKALRDGHSYWKFIELLDGLVKHGEHVDYVADRASATAAQRGKALLHALNLWTDSEGS